MPTIDQLPQATQVNATDQLMLDQSGVSVAATVAQVLSASATTITLTGDVTGSGSSTIVTTLAPVATPGTYAKVSVNAKGLVTGGGALAGADVINALGYTPYSSANPSGYAVAASLAKVATSGAFADLVGAPAIGSIAGQSASAVAITGGSIAGADVSAASVLASGGTAARTLAARAGERLDVLDFGADPTGMADSAPAFAAAMAAVPNGAWGGITVPAGTYLLNSFLNQPSGRSIAFEFLEGANISGPGGLGVDRIESRQGPYTQWTGGGGWFGFAPTPGSQTNYGFHSDVVQNTPANSGSSRVGWSRNYTNYNYYGKYINGIDIAEQNIYSWPHLYDNSSGWGHWEVITGSTLDEDSALRGHLVASGEHSEYDVVNNGPEAGWTWKSGAGNPVQGMSIDPWGQNGQYGGNILYNFGSVGSYDGNVGGLNWRWPSYPAVFSIGNPSAVATNSTIVITFDATAHASASVVGGGVASVAVSNGGGLYSSAPGVTFSGGGGAGAAGTAVMLGTSVIGVTITAAGSGYTSAPTVSFTGGGVAAPVATTVTLNADGAHGDLASIAAAINAAGVPLVRAAVAKWGGVVSRLVVFGTAAADLGTLTLGGTALGTLGIAAQAYSTPRDTYAVVMGGTGSCLPTDQLTLNGTTITVGGAGATSDVVAAINGANLVGIRADKNAVGQLVLTCWIPQNPGGLIIAQPAGYTTLSKLSLTAGTFWPPVPPKGFATAYGELTSPVCKLTDQISIAATDMTGVTYGPVTVTLNGGAGTGWPADVAASIRAAMTTAGFYSATYTTLTAPPAVVAVVAKGSGANQGVLLRNTAGGTLTLANVTGTPLQTLGMTAGTYQPGGYSAAAQSVFMAAEDSIAPQGRGIFLGGASNSTDQTTYPNAPLEVRGSFLHGLRTDHATFTDNTALLLGSGQAIGFGMGSGALSLTANGTALQVNGAALALASAVPTRLSQLSNDAGYLASVPVASTSVLGGVIGDGSTVTISPSGVLSVAGTVAFGAGATAVTAGNGDNSARLATTAYVYQATAAVITIATTGGTTTLSPAQYGVPLLLVSGALTSNAVLVVPNSGEWTISNATTGAFTLTVKTAAGGGVVIDQGSNAEVFANGSNVALCTTDFNAITLQGAVSNAGTISGGVVAPGTLVVGGGGSTITVAPALDASGYHPLVLRASGANTNVPLVLAPAGTGYLAAGLSDGTAANGNQRGQYAVDLQQSRVTAAQVASGAYAAIPGGAANTASGSYSLAAGQGSSAAGQGSIALGQYANDGGAYGKLVFSANAGTVGNQFGVSTLFVSSVTAATRMTSDGAAAGSANSLPIRTNHVIAGTLTIAARNVTTGDGASWSIPVLFKNSAGTVSVSSPGTAAIAPTVADASLAGASVAIAADNTNKALSVTITPPASVTLNASAVFLAAEM